MARTLKVAALHVVDTSIDSCSELGHGVFVRTAGNSARRESSLIHRNSIRKRDGRDRRKEGDRANREHDDTEIMERRD